MKELKVGERVTITIEDGEKITIEAVEQKNSCKGCFFYKGYCAFSTIKCSKFIRSDRKDVIFKEVKE